MPITYLKTDPSTVLTPDPGKVTVFIDTTGITQMKDETGVVTPLQGSGGSGSGTAGNTIITGTTAPLPATGNNGDYFINKSFWLIYGPKANGAWPAGVSIIGATGATGPQGATGGTGPQGAAGNTILNGTVTPPANTTGNNGDFYLHTPTNTLWGPKASSAWPTSGVALTGASNSGLYDFGLYIEGLMTASEVVWRFVAPRNFTLPANIPGFQAIAPVTATSTAVLTLRKNGTSIGTITFAANSNTGVLSFINAVGFVAGDVIELDAPATADATLANVAITITATRP